MKPASKTLPSTADVTPETLAIAAGISGSATLEQKEVLARSILFFGRPGGDFAADVASRIRPVRYDVFQDATNKTRTEMECELVVGDDMLNYHRTLHGGCTAYLIDVCTMHSLIPIVQGHLTLSMDFVCHAPAPHGVTLKIVSKTITLGKRVFSLRCKIYDKNTGRLCVSGNHLKVPLGTTESRL
ncbi:hypothetical protein BKA62DRAFT_491935 [Auriculariales sp. MPI-PUGE-AT-0066]|nr:hypothetical protein BKA62DRAFT_491935 [Auriculariales sp. MPI-PUGE-AT-0066]